MLKKNIIISDCDRKLHHTFSDVVSIACSFQSQIFITDGDRQANAKSIMGVMALGLADGMQVEITAEGSDEEAAVSAMEECLA